MLRSLALFSGPEASVHIQSLADFITTTSGFRFSVHTPGKMSACDAGLAKDTPSTTCCPTMRKDRHNTDSVRSAYDFREGQLIDAGGVHLTMHTSLMTLGNMRKNGVRTLASLLFAASLLAESVQAQSLSQQDLDLSCAIARSGLRYNMQKRTQKSRPLRKAAYHKICPELSAYVGDALLGIHFGRGLWLRRQLKHRCLLTLT
jgi:hypothetical protein